jgi:hypothetical protein
MWRRRQASNCDVSVQPQEGKGEKKPERVGGDLQRNVGRKDENREPVEGEANASILLLISRIYRMVKQIVVKKILTDAQVEKLAGKKLPTGYFKTVLRENADVWTEEGTLLLKYRRNVLPRANLHAAFDNLIKHARQKTSARGIFSGQGKGKRDVRINEKIATNIVGYFDTIGITQKALLRKAGLKLPKCRPSAFTENNPKKWKKIIPLIKDISNEYKKLFPAYYDMQKKAVRNNKYIIPGTVYSTVTTNLNVQSAVHRDKGDYSEGFGNLVVISKGNYKGGFTGFPQYGVAMDVRTGDFAGMNVHEWHANEPIRGLGDKMTLRLSLVSYLRERLAKNCKGIPLLPAGYFKKAAARLARMDAKTRKGGSRRRRKKRTRKRRRRRT